ncbi:hypothetical protein [Rhodopila sp.]|uniref:hypothetical protein n=1 Tax=Rhodopila sp. TaxID=2480087 RepID=UPI003D1486A5
MSSNTSNNVVKLSVAYETGSPIADGTLYGASTNLTTYTDPHSGNGAVQLSRTELVRLSLADATSTALSFWALLQSGESNFAIPANDVVHRLLSVNQGLFTNALQKCREVLDEIDPNDEVSLEVARVRLKDLFDVFSDLSAGLVGELASAYRDQPDLLGFVLSDCFVDVRSVQPAVKVAVASRLLLNDKASIRYEAVRALDAINDTAASAAMRLLQASETNRDVKNLIEASLGSPS